jgi:hypothetical protein
MRHVVVVFMLTALVATASNAPGAADSDAVAKLQRELIDAYIHRDASVLQRILSDDYVFTQDYGGLDTKADVLRSFAAGGDRNIISYVIRDSSVNPATMRQLPFMRMNTRVTLKSAPSSRPFVCLDRSIRKRRGLLQSATIPETAWCFPSIPACDR